MTDLALQPRPLAKALLLAQIQMQIFAHVTTTKSEYQIMSTGVVLMDDAGRRTLAFPVHASSRAEHIGLTGHCKTLANGRSVRVATSRT